MEALMKTISVSDLIFLGKFNRIFSYDCSSDGCGCDDTNCDSCSCEDDDDCGCDDNCTYDISL